VYEICILYGANDDAMANENHTEYWMSYSPDLISYLNSNRDAPSCALTRRSKNGRWTLELLHDIAADEQLTIAYEVCSEPPVDKFPHSHAQIVRAWKTIRSEIVLRRERVAKKVMWLLQDS
jgi:hypothetical protein